MKTKVMVRITFIITLILTTFIVNQITRAVEKDFVAVTAGEIQGAA